ncbi:EAL domain-containing protein [Demequina sp. SO4-18]|uniref:sensor domain-containing protein n=1 Tax=Demequina sp. SO4-18 TaxID=3401026 RepID=UPI003B5C3C17
MMWHSVDQVIRGLPIPVAAVKTDPDGACEIVTVNPAFARLFAVTSARAQGQDLRRYFTWDQQEEGLEVSARTADGLLRLEATTREPFEGSQPVILTVAPLDDDGPISLVASRAAEVDSLAEALRQSREQVHELVEDSTDMNYFFDSSGIVIDLNPAGASMLGDTRDNLVGTHCADYVHAEDRDQANALISRVFDRRAEEFEVRLMSRSGETVLVEVLARPYIEDGVVTGVFGRARNITDKRGMEERLRHSEERYRALYDDNVDAVVTFDVEGRFLYVNAATSSLMGRPAEELLGKPFLPFILPERQEQTFAEFAKVLEGRTVQYETAMHNSRQEVVDLHITVIPIIVGSEVHSIHCIAKDITERRHLRQTLHEMAYLDTITGLPNFNALGDALDGALRSKSPLDLLVIDVDRLKVVNDTWGRSVGDRLLAAVARRLQEFAGQNGRLFRYASDDFVVLHPHTSEEAGLAYAHGLEHALREPFVIGDLPVMASVSIGIATYPADGLDADTLLRKADDAMLHAKRSGQHHVALHRALGERESTRARRMELALRHALVNDELTLVYQPQVDLLTGEIHGAEALLRWRHPEFGDVSPDEFIPVAERAGLIHEIGVWVLENACRQQVRWRSDDVGEVPVAVNISVDQFYDVEFGHHVERVLRETGITPRSLTLEITETVASQPDVVVDQLHRFTSLGVQVAIDDFGTGYSSLRYLKDFPVDFIKIDRSFVDQVETSQRDRELIATIVSLAHNFGLATIAEGVETLAQLEFLRGLGAEFAQGFYFGRPMPPAEFEHWLAQRSIPEVTPT